MIGEAYKSRYSWGQATSGSIIYYAYYILLLSLFFIKKNKTDIGHPALLVSVAKQTPPRLRAGEYIF